MGDLVFDVSDDTAAHGQRRDGELLDLGRFGVAGDVVEHQLDVMRDVRVGGEVGQVRIDSRGDRMVVAGADVNKVHKLSILPPNDQR